MSVVPQPVHIRAVEQREQRIAQLETEIERLGNIITTQADRIITLQTIIDMK